MAYFHLKGMDHPLAGCWQSSHVTTVHVNVLSSHDLIFPTWVHLWYVCWICYCRTSVQYKEIMVKCLSDAQLITEVHRVTCCCLV